MAGSFLAEDFAFSTKLPAARARALVEDAARAGYLALGPPLRLTEAGRLALLGRLAAYGGRWWLLTDRRRLTYFMVREEGLWVAPYTTLLWEEAGGEAGDAFVVRGAIGGRWREAYVGFKPFTELWRLEAECEKLVMAITGRGAGVAQAAARLALMWKSLDGIARRTRLGAVGRPALRTWEEVVRSCEELLSAVRRVREELGRRLE